MFIKLVIKTNYLSVLCASISLFLAALLPFAIPFDASRNIDMQGLLLVIAGGFGWLALGFERRKPTAPKSAVWLLGIFIFTCVVSTAVNPHLGYDLLGAPYVRLGTAGLLSAIGCGLAALRLPLDKFLRYLYFEILAIAILSLVYNLLVFGALIRMNGVLAQADILACVLGVGWLLGWYMLERYPDRKHVLLGSQLFLTVMLALTETRAVLALVFILGLTWMINKRRWKAVAGSLLAGLLLLVLLLVINAFVPGRLTDSRYAASSLRYRLDLQRQALRASGQKPLWGYGPGNLADALSCSGIPSGPLRITCRQGYFFNSSHNVFLDRILAVGWPGGTAYLALVVVAVYKGWRVKQELQVAIYAIALIGLYYLTNVTDVVLELLLWLLLLRCLADSKKPSRAAT